MSETKPLQPGDIATIAYFGGMPYHRRIGRVLQFHSASYDVIVCDGHLEFEATVAASEVAPASREELEVALRSRMEAPHAYVQKPAPPKSKPVEEPIERVVPGVLETVNDDGTKVSVIGIDITGNRSVDRRTRELLQTLIDLTHVCDRATFRPADQPVVEHAAKVLSRHLDPILAGGA